VVAFITLAILVIRGFFLSAIIPLVLLKLCTNTENGKSKGPRQLRMAEGIDSPALVEVSLLCLPEDEQSSAQSEVGIG